LLPSIPSFISRHITHRPESLFTDDLARYHAELSAAIDGKSLLVIGGAGTIGSSFVRAALRYRPARLYVCDINENGLTSIMEVSSGFLSKPPLFLVSWYQSKYALLERIDELATSSRNSQQGREMQKKCAF
jgi:hypothetical protein